GTQLELGMRERNGHGGKRDRAGRKRRASRKQVPHVPRPHLTGRIPVLVTIRVAAYVASLRSAPCFGVVLQAMKAAAERLGARIVAYAVLGNHIHLVMEAESRTALSRALIGLNTRIGKGINQITGTQGRVIEDRPHVHQLKTPSEVKNALRYVAENARRHAERMGKKVKEFADRFASLGAIDLRTAPWLAAIAVGPGLGAAPQSWLLREG